MKISLSTSSWRMPVGDQLLQPPVLLLELSQSLHVGCLQRAEVLPPGINRVGR